MPLIVIFEQQYRMAGIAFIAPITTLATRLRSYRPQSRHTSVPEILADSCYRGRKQDWRLILRQRRLLRHLALRN